jgi:hypothetical protein
MSAGNKEIFSSTGKAAEQSKNLVLRQKQDLNDWIAEIQEGAEEKDALK